MSCNIRTYESLDLGPGSDYMTLTAFIGGGGDCKGCQFTIGSTYCALDEKAIRDLIATLNRRLECAEGYSAIGREKHNIAYGKEEVLQEVLTKGSQEAIR